MRLRDAYACVLAAIVRTQRRVVEALGCETALYRIQADFVAEGFWLRRCPTKVLGFRKINAFISNSTTFAALQLPLQHIETSGEADNVNE
jgi:hypothetical protein